ncbi:hypothetical protein LTR84_001021 [Exophiala bonariae]|uniref:Uncharacterized protein n=1 Tax=Exophiala bonariae TaxID=1690606 RepID=A0AAV9NST0_9EURO|nr:hypothetical protein LTR84_001021 [Exophiala bonariae]
MVLTEGQQSEQLAQGHDCYACKHAFIAADRAMKTSSSSDENYGALPSSYRRLRKSKSMITSRSSYSQPRGHFSPLLRVKQSISRLRPAWRPPGIIDPGQAVTKSTPSRSSGKQSRPLDHLARQSSRRGKEPSSTKQLSRAEISSLPKLSGQSIAECAKTSYGDFRIPGDDKSHMKKLGFSKREIFLIGRKREERNSAAPSYLREERTKIETTQAASQKQPSPAPKPFSNHFSGSIWATVKGSLKKRSVSAQLLGTERTPSEERNIPSSDNHAKDHKISHPSDVLSPMEQDEAIDSLANDLHQSASRESLHSNNKSRVTSWTNSSTTGSVALRSGPLELNRLSVIKEDGGPHQPSSSAGRHIGGVSLFQEPLQSTTGDGQTLLPVDSQRIYSALIERIRQEEAEIEDTAAALKALNQERAINTPISIRQEPTIRFVKSDSSMTGTVCADTQPPLNDPSLPEVACSETQIHGQATHELRGYEHHDQPLESFPSFLPFPVERKSNRPSPFQQIFRHKRTHNINNNLSGAERYLSVNPHSDPPNLGRLQFGNSSDDSIYSRATDGLPKFNHMSSGESAASLIWSPNRLFKSKSMVEPMNTMRVVSKSPSSFQHFYNPAEIQECNPWLSSRNSSLGSHAREQAEDGDIELSLRHMNLSSDQSIAGTESSAPTTTHAKVKMMFRRGRTPSEKPNYPLSIDQNKQGHTSNNRSAGREHNKETQIFGHVGTPPLSTPGRLHLQAEIGSWHRKLKQSNSEVPFNIRRSELHASPISNMQTGSVTFSDNGDSPSQKVKDRLVARLSRPFDMDVPRHNRPFDSMYLGKRTPGHADTLGHSRLSVAPRESKSYGGLRRPPKNIQDDALPIVTSSSTTVSRSASKIASLFSGRRMVSNFLRTRRIERSVSADEKDTYAGGPAFI